MSKKPISVDFDACIVNVQFIAVEDRVVVSKDYLKGSDVIHRESHSYSLKTMPLQVALQMACAIVSNVGLLDFVEDAK